MRTLRLRLVAIVTVALVLGAVAAVVAQDVDDEVVEPESILFVGNSLTYRNGGVGTHVAGLAGSGSEPIALEVEESTSGSATLLTHRFLGAEDIIRGGGYDIVVLQGDIPANQGRTELFLENARLLARVVDDSGARTVFFMAWPSENVDWVGLDDIVAAHRQVVDELDATVAPVGTAMERAQADRPDLVLIVDGAGHTSPAGTYLAAATIYATVFDRSPEGLRYRMEAVSEDDAAFLQRVAWEATQDWLGTVSPDS